MQKETLVQLSEDVARLNDNDFKKLLSLREEIKNNADEQKGVVAICLHIIKVIELKPISEELMEVYHNEMFGYGTNEEKINDLTGNIISHILFTQVHICILFYNIYPYFKLKIYLISNIVSFIIKNKNKNYFYNKN